MGFHQYWKDLSIIICFIILTFKQNETDANFWRTRIFDLTMIALVTDKKQTELSNNTMYF